MARRKASAVLRVYLTRREIRFMNELLEQQKQKLPNTLSGLIGRPRRRMETLEAIQNAFGEAEDCADDSSEEDDVP